MVSPAERARATAAPTIRRFPKVPREEWPIHEFTYLSPARCAGTNLVQRRAWVDAYWTTADPAYVDGPDAESFEAFITRVDLALRMLNELDVGTCRAALFFGHGQFINAMRWRLQAHCDRLDLQDFRAFDLRNIVSHCSLLMLEPARP